MQLTIAHIKSNQNTFFFGHKPAVTRHRIVKTSTVPLTHMDLKITQCTLIKHKCSSLEIIIYPVINESQLQSRVSTKYHNSLSQKFVLNVFIGIQCILMLEKSRLLKGWSHEHLFVGTE